ncbi:MAG: sensor histidine kinase [Ilumatobacteraceae bacterium]|nr:sensor histidine kinase [Ilumatobacteraceae bacterium]
MTFAMPARLGRWGAEHPFRVDVVIAVVVGLFTVLGLVAAEPQGSERAADPLAVMLVAGQTVSFAYRRRAPLLSVVAVSVFTVAFWVADYATNFDVFTLLAVYAATAHGGGDRRKVWRVVGAVVGFVSVIAVLGVLSPNDDLPAAAVLGIAALHITAAIAGEVVHDRRLRLAELEQRAVRAETERSLMAREAIREERARIARDLHDVVAHGMSVMVVQAGAAERIVDADPDGARKALQHIQSAGREALTEMRRMLDLLREAHPAALDLAPQPTVHDLHHVVQQCSDSGIPTELRIDGEPSSQSVGQEMAAYRIAQEALTNVIKHAGGSARAMVRVQYRSDDIRLEVTDDGIGASERDLSHATGHGLVGMRERVELYGGDFRVGPRPGGGFRVAATIPYDHQPSRTRR